MLTVRCDRISNAANSPIYIHADSHDDPGFRTTFEKLFHGVRVDLHKEIHFVSVERIISNVIDELVLNPDRRLLSLQKA